MATVNDIRESTETKENCGRVQCFSLTQTSGLQRATKHLCGAYLVFCFHFTTKSSGFPMLVAVVCAKALSQDCTKRSEKMDRKRLGGAEKAK